MKLRNLKVITECGVMLATALALANLKLYQLPSGGSVSLGSLPLLLLAARHGAFTGMTCGVLLGFLSLLSRPYIVHPLQFLLDYPLAFASLGLAGAVSWNKGLKAATATTAANLIRLHFHVVAGAVFFVADQETIRQAITISYAYNLGHMLPETVILAALTGYLAGYQPALCARQGG